MTEIKVRFKSEKHDGYIICRRLNKVFYIFKDARPSLQYGWICKCGQFTKLDPYYHDVTRYVEYDEDDYPEIQNLIITDENVAKSPVVTCYIKYWTGVYPNEIEHDRKIRIKKILMISKVAELCKKVDANTWIVFNNKHKQIYSGERK